MLIKLTSAMGYRDSHFYSEGEPLFLLAQSDMHWYRAAKAAGVQGTYYFRTSEQSARPALHVAEVGTRAEARRLHQTLWNQGVTPFLLVLLPDEVRVYSGFAFHPDDDAEGSVQRVRLEAKTLTRVADELASFSASSIDAGRLWTEQAKHLRPDTRVDATLLKQLRVLSQALQNAEYGLDVPTSHALIGKFVYLHFLRARNILSDQWLEQEAACSPGDVFSRDATFAGFRRVAHAVERRFNGNIFELPWTGERAPRADAVQLVARVFVGDTLGGQLHLPFSAYDFDSIPIELLSTIYEQFLHVEGSPDTHLNPPSPARRSNAVPSHSNPETNGAHYTPEPLAEYLISEVDSVRPLQLGMRILDPCCGSGVFLVLAYRRLVESHCRTLPLGQKPKPSDLRQILVSHIYGAERNRTACQIAAFSLILTMLSYIEPPELHRNQKFQFPSLINENLFVCDFFDDRSRLWTLRDGANEPVVFDWIIGNPPWVELDKDDPEAGLTLAWYHSHAKDLALARMRTGEAFAWRVLERLARGGIVGLVLGAKTLTNDHLKNWRKRFFSQNHIRRITNLSNLAYAIFPSADAPTFTVIYSKQDDGEPKKAILHVGPFVAHQVPLQGGQRRLAWSIAVTESEVKTIAAADAATGEASVWKLALWGNQRDARAVSRVASVFTTTLGELVTERGWSMGLGVQLRATQGTKKDPADYLAELEGLDVLDHKALIRLGPRLAVPAEVLKANAVGHHVRRRGGIAGLRLLRHPHLFLWNDYAAFGDRDFVIQHDKIGLAAAPADEDWLRAIAVLWSSSVAGYFLFWRSAAWGIDRTQIDLGDARDLPMPALDSNTVARLSDVHRRLSKRHDFRTALDAEVTSLLALPRSLAALAAEFRDVRLQLNKGKTPDAVTRMPTGNEMEAYALGLRDELDTFVANRARHRVSVIHSSSAIATTVEITSERSCIAVDVEEASGPTSLALQDLVRAAELRFSQWMYVKRSVRLLDGKRVHIIKPARRLEWTRTQAALDAADIIGEIAEAGRGAP